MTIDEIAKLLKVEKRRAYDIVNILDGTNFISKTKKGFRCGSILLNNQNPEDVLKEQREFQMTHLIRIKACEIYLRKLKERKQVYDQKLRRIYDPKKYKHLSLTTKIVKLMNELRHKLEPGSALVAVVPRRGTPKIISNNSK